MEQTKKSEGKEGLKRGRAIKKAEKWLGVARLALNGFR
jgi:hypothetical protein